MKVTILQMDISWNQPDCNIAEAERLINNSPPADLYVLPEMWNTGFDMHPRGEHTENNSAALAWMKRTAHATRAALCGSLAIKDDEGRWRNRCYFVRPDGTFDFYDKHHLFTYSGENTAYAAGQKRSVAEWKGWRFLLLTCYDLRFPVWSRYHEDYDAIIVVANWPDSRQHAWNILTRARAIENQCYLIGCNRVGADELNPYAGGSCILESRGYVIAEASADSSVQTVTGDISLSTLNLYRNKFRTLQDRDK